MQQEKSKILEEVTETETYKKAKEILLRFAPDQLKMTPVPVKVPPMVEKSWLPSSAELRRRTSAVDKLRQSHVPQIAMSPLTSSTPGSGELRRRTDHPSQLVNVQSGVPVQIVPVGATPIKSTQLNTMQTGSKVLSSTPMGYTTPERTLARPILSHHKSLFDRLIDYLVGDGPSNRYALICRQCECHNGMALKEEFEYLGFRCCYCNFWNPPRKQKPGIQKIENSIHSSTTSETPTHNLTDKGAETLKLAEASYSSDTDSDIEVVEKPGGITENQERIVDEYPKVNEEDTQNQEEKKSDMEPMEVEN